MRRGSAMKWLGGLIAGSGIAAFFFFSWIIQMLFNSIIVRHLGLFKPLSYLQAAGLWFLITLLFAWIGIGVTRGIYRVRWERDWSEIGDRIERKIKQKLKEWAEGEEEWGEVERKIEEKIKRKIKEWAEED